MAPCQAQHEFARFDHQTQQALLDVQRSQTDCEKLDARAHWTVKYNVGDDGKKTN